jgi:hypothetical protein
MQTALRQPRRVVLSACATGLHDINEMPEEFVELPGPLLPLMDRQFAGATKLYASYLSALATLSGTGADELPLELRETTEDRQH